MSVKSFLTTDGIQVTVSGSLSGLMVEDDTYDPNYQEANYLSPYFLKQGDIRCQVKCRTCIDSLPIAYGYRKCQISGHRCAKGWIFCDNHRLLPEVREVLKLKPENLPLRGGWLHESSLPRL